jgi:hypothetical protein
VTKRDEALARFGRSPRPRYTVTVKDQAGKGRYMPTVEEMAGEGHLAHPMSGEGRLSPTHRAQVVGHDTRLRWCCLDHYEHWLRYGVAEGVA